MKLWFIALVIISITQTHGRRKDCRQCKAGHYARRTCNELHDTVCAQCPVGTYTPESNTRELCYSCSTCKEGYFVIKSCTFRHDTVCGSCELKDYSELNSYSTKCAHKRKGNQNDQPLETPLTSDDSLDISGDGELIVDHGSLKPTVIDDVIIDKESVSNTSQLEKDALEEGSGGFNISVPSEELESSPTFTSPQSILVSNESTTVTSNATSKSETLRTTYPETTNVTSTSEPSLNTSSTIVISNTEGPSSTTSSASEPTTISTTEPSSTIIPTSSTLEPSSTTIHASSTPEPSSTTILTTQSEIPDPEPEPEPTHKPEPKQSTAESKTEATTTQTTSTTQAVTTKTTKIQTTLVPTTSTTTLTTTKSKDYFIDKDDSIIIDLRGTTEKIIDLRTKKTTASPKLKTTTSRTIDLDRDKGIVIETGIEEDDEKERYDVPDFTLPETEIKEKSPLQPGALGSEKMDEEDGIKVGIVVAIVIGAAVIFFLIGFLVSRYCRKRRSGKFHVKNDLERGPVKDNAPTALDYKDGGIYDEIGKETVTLVNNGKPNGTTHSTEDVYAVPDKRKNGEPGSPKIDEQLNKIKFIDDPEEEAEPKEGDKLLDDSDEKYSSFASIPNGSVKQNGDVAPNDYVSESSPILSSGDTHENPDESEEATSGKESDDAEMSPLLEKTEVDESQKETSS
ncbi:uncharacterized protein LOC133182671 [Saccostrea echinata]|uniref:uncharacterized protein LOC133182671 n=1 Tax=Saccostrea echinata TaxID=191078 RepID=UPI002A7F23E5|nr:uncharacterized protein LOC133182671 [Saccostrea echinata]